MDTKESDFETRYRDMHSSEFDELSASELIEPAQRASGLIRGSSNAVKLPNIAEKKIKDKAENTLIRAEIQQRKIRKRARLYSAPVALVLACGALYLIRGSLSGLVEGGGLLAGLLAASRVCSRTCCFARLCSAPTMQKWAAQAAIPPNRARRHRICHIRRIQAPTLPRARHVIAAVGLNQLAPGSRHLPNGRLLAPDCTLTGSRMHRVAHPKPQNRDKRQRFRPILDCGTVCWEGSPGKSQLR